MLKPHPRKGLTPTDAWHLYLALFALSIVTTRADTVYRCGDAYSPISQCANGSAEEIKPNAKRQSAESTPANAAANDWREAQTLEKQRLQTERQLTSSVPLRFSATRPSSAKVANTEPYPSSEHKHSASRRQSPYFTAVDPNTPRKKKSTAQAVPPNTP